MYYGCMVAVCRDCGKTESSEFSILATQLREFSVYCKFGKRAILDSCAKPMQQFDHSLALGKHGLFETCCFGAVFYGFHRGYG